METHSSCSWLENPHGQRSLVGCSPWGCKESDMTERLSTAHSTCATCSLVLYVWLHGLYPARLLCPWGSPGKNTGVGCRGLLQGIFPTQELNPGLHTAGAFFTIWATREAPRGSNEPWSSWQQSCIPLWRLYRIIEYVSFLFLLLETSCILWLIPLSLSKWGPVVKSFVQCFILSLFPTFSQECR